MLGLSVTAEAHMPQPPDLDVICPLDKSTDTSFVAAVQACQRERDWATLATGGHLCFDSNGKPRLVDAEAAAIAIMAARARLSDVVQFDTDGRPHAAK